MYRGARETFQSIFEDCSSGYITHGNLKTSVLIKILILEMTQYNE